jgi:hypothetical protein
MSRRPFTLILPYYENPGMLARQFASLSLLADDVRKALHLIVVDDGSPKSPAREHMPTDLFREAVEGKPLAGFKTFTPGDKVTACGLASFQLFTVEVDVRWNWLTCRNIGAHHAKTDWLLFTDIDHLLPEETARFIQETKLDPARSYRFSRVDAPDLTPYKPHPNSWLMTADRFDKIGGYDERFSGFYGTDGEFRDRVKANSREIVMLDQVLVRVPREVIPDASTTAYGRKEKQDHDGVTRARARIAREGGRPLNRSFPYHQVF